METFLRLQGVTKAFSGAKALDAVNLSIQAGEVCCLLGENGSGKSTLIKVLSGVHAPDGGQILVDGRAVQSWRPIDAIHAGIEVIYQDFSLFPNLTVMENLTLLQQIAQDRKWVHWGRLHTTAQEALRKIGVDMDLHMLASEVSVAQRQIIAIARALMGKPRLIVMDEPTSALTGREIQSLLAIIEQLSARGIAIIFVSHKLDEVMRVARHLVVLRNGSKVFDGAATGFTRADLVRHMVGRDLLEERQSFSKPQGDVLLTVRGLGRQRYYQDIHFELRRGEVLGLTGQLDSGRTALALSLYGMLKPDSGSVTVDGKEVVLDSVAVALAHGIAMVPEDRLCEGLFLPRSIGDNLSAGVLDSLGGHFGLLRSKAVDNFENHWIKKLAIKTRNARLPVSTLSGGNQQRVVLAKALARKPKVLILNAPTVGVDVGSKDEIHQIIEQLSAEGMGVIVVSDDNTELLRLCHRLVVMRQGRIADVCTVDSRSQETLQMKEAA